jgi:rubrerythrin
MDAGSQELIEGIRAAMLAERAGYEFYRMAAERTQDPEGRKVFEQLAQEEQAHFEYLGKHYQALVAKGALAKGVTLDKAHQLATNHPIFSPELKARLKGAHFEMSALAIAAQLELNGINHYHSLASKATAPAAKKLFEELADWERGHYCAFIRQQQELQEAYWDEAGFSPF